MELMIRLRSVGSLSRFIAENRSGRFRRPFRVRVRSWQNNGQNEGTATTIVNPEFSGSVLRVPLPQVQRGQVLGVVIEIVPRTIRGADAAFVTTGRIELTNTDGTQRARPTSKPDPLSRFERINLYAVSDWTNALTTFRNDQVTADDTDFELLGLAYGFPELERFHEPMWRSKSSELSDFIASVDDVTWSNLDGELDDVWASARHTVSISNRRVDYVVRTFKQNGAEYGTCRFGVQVSEGDLPAAVRIRRIGFDVERPFGSRVRATRREHLLNMVDRFVAVLRNDLAAASHSAIATAAVQISDKRVDRGWPESLYNTVYFSNISSSVVPSWQQGRSIAPVAAHRPAYRGGFATVEPSIATATLQGGLRRL
jgi:hypothetical protein